MIAFAYSELPENCAPEIARLVEYWRSIHPEFGLPGRQHFDPIDIPHLLPNLWLLDVSRDPLRFRVRLTGTAINKFTGRDSTGKWCDEVFADFEKSDAYICARACALSAKPQYRKSEAVSDPGCSSARAERVYLPLATNSRDVDIILSMSLYPDRRLAPR